MTIPFLHTHTVAGVRGVPKIRRPRMSYRQWRRPTRGELLDAASARVLLVAAFTAVFTGNRPVALVVVIGVMLVSAIRWRVSALLAVIVAAVVLVLPSAPVTYLWTIQ